MGKHREAKDDVSSQLANRHFKVDKPQKLRRDLSFVYTLDATMLAPLAPSMNPETGEVSWQNPRRYEAHCHWAKRGTLLLYRDTFLILEIQEPKVKDVDPHFPNCIYDGFIC
jgi:hypothetical protein